MTPVDNLRDDCFPGARMATASDIEANVRRGTPAPEWTLHPLPAMGLPRSVEGFFRLGCGTLFFGFWMAVAMSSALVVLAAAGGRTLPSAGPAAWRLGLAVAVFGGLAGLGLMLMRDLRYEALVITEDRAALVGLGPLRRRRTRVLIFAELRGMVVQQIRYDGRNAPAPAWQLHLRGFAGRTSQWNIGAGELVLRDVVAHFERKNPNDATDLSDLTFVQTRED